MKVFRAGMALAGLMLTGCQQAPAQAAGGAIEAVNHTRWAINHFSVNGQSGLDIIGPHQGGGGGCCFRAPAQWQPGMTVKIDWETGMGGTKGFPGYEDREAVLAWVKKVKEAKKRHSAVVPVPDYTGQKTCGITVHFLPCDKVKVTTSCHIYSDPQYPVKEPLSMPEPATCAR
ncbi:DUF3304 domain-containing protein [Tenebrionicola larvae]|jgi:hypothetical protein|uniref:DUF3304 domain-containing protein n=2 Tax=Tenebrionibacter/Tenebrionicola group TaxID=2969848 RepID=A0A949Q7C9_9ENTR|nr:DUF3304 domain-containing protein [Tenebrionicola larvae]MBV5097642.1 DUF3304 domain-containing protein [Tenebrionicola larvae]